MASLEITGVSLRRGTPLSEELISDFEPGLVHQMHVKGKVVVVSVYEMSSGGFLFLPLSFGLVAYTDDSGPDYGFFSEQGSLGYADSDQHSWHRISHLFLQLTISELLIKALAHRAVFFESLIHKMRSDFIAPLYSMTDFLIRGSLPLICTLIRRTLLGALSPLGKTFDEIFGLPPTVLGALSGTQATLFSGVLAVAAVPLTMVGGRTRREKLQGVDESNGFFPKRKLFKKKQSNDWWTIAGFSAGLLKPEVKNFPR
ncbi:hypothetical protein F2Q69_00052088 [Brassica cretica]|uniref:Uncharacterized protein n=1 Tax=Brassica cretica TaxID=69181 RepID=A0A8S9N863_BRACR|nr:hypothetical protein F2Q69_00052088 [Brassica cretica]